MQKLSKLIPLAALLAVTSGQVSITGPTTAQVMKGQEPTASSNVLTDATTLVNKNNAVVDNNIDVS